MFLIDVSESQHRRIDNMESALLSDERTDMVGLYE